MEKSKMGKLRVVNTSMEGVLMGPTSAMAMCALVLLYKASSQVLTPL